MSAELTRLTELARGPHQRLAAPSGHPAADSADAGLAGATSERTFVALKRPKGHAETVTVLGYWLRATGKPDFSEDDVRRAYIRAGIRPPKVVSQALRDAKRHMDSIDTGTRRGRYSLTPHGERVVLFDLPRTSASDE